MGNNRAKYNMKNKYLQLSLMLLICGAMMTLTGCDKDDDYNGQGSSDDEGTTNEDYVFYKSVSAKKLTVVNSDLSSTSYETIDIYKKESKYYYRRSTYNYIIAVNNSEYEFLGVIVSSYDYYCIYVGSLSVRYYYYFDL